MGLTLLAISAADSNIPVLLQSLTLAGAVRECEEKERRVAELEQRLAAVEQQNGNLVRPHQHPPSTQLTHSTPNYIQGSQKTVPPSNGNHENLKKEHADLLLLLAEQDKKLTGYKRRLLERGEQVSDDDNDEEEGAGSVSSLQAELNAEANNHHNSRQAYQQPAAVNHQPPSTPPAHYSNLPAYQGGVGVGGGGMEGAYDQDQLARGLQQVSMGMGV